MHAEQQAISVEGRPTPTRLNRSSARRANRSDVRSRHFRESDDTSDVCRKTSAIANLCCSYSRKSMPIHQR